MLSESILNESMQLACAEARKWLGATSPNPPVGAVALDSEGKVLALASHHKAGEFHAEATLLQHCRTHNLLSRIHTLCVTLEPCNHQGRTPPCTEAIIEAGIKHVVIGTRDPNVSVKGGGMERLREAGIAVLPGVGEEECRQLIHVFAHKAVTGRPWITVKRAFDDSGSMIPVPGKKVFTSPDSLIFAHRLRKKADAILTGSGTVLADNPLFNVRNLPDYPGKRRWLAILDRRSRVPNTYLKAAHERGLDVLIFQDIRIALESLTARGAQDILVEAGPTLSQALFEAGLWTMKVDIHRDEPDRIKAFFNPKETLPFTADKFRWEWVLPA